MEWFTRIADAYRTVDPGAWVGAFRLLPVWAAAVAIATGLLLLLLGGGAPFRFLAGPVGALVGALTGPLVAARLGSTVEPRAIALGAAATLATLGFLVPQAVTFLTVGVLAGLLGGRLAGKDDWVLGFFPALLILGVVGLVLHRFFAAIVSSAVGAWLFCLGVLAAVRSLGAFSEAVAARPLGVVAAAVLFTVAGAVYQLAVRLSPEERAKRSGERVRAKKREAEDEALEKRWGKFGGDDE